MSEAKEKHQEFIDGLFGDVKKAQGDAEIHKDTKVVNFKPSFNDEFSQADLEKAIQYINRQGAIVGAATANIGYEQYPEGKAEHWTGILDLGPLKITAESHLRETYEMGADKKEHAYGITDVCFDYTYSDPLTSFLDHFAELDSERCSKLFEDA